MADEGFTSDAIERLEWDERKLPDSRFKTLRQMTRRTALTGGAAAIAATVLEACGKSGTTSSSASTGSGGAANVFGNGQKYHFVMVNHVTTNSFFTATIYGCQDACALTGSSFQWTGSTNSIVNQMVSAFNSAIAAKASGIGCCLIDNTAFNSPVDSALSAGIPVIAYNADVAAGTPNHRMAYVGQNNLTAGAAVGKQILSTGVKSGDLVAGIIATPGTGNIQPRIDGAKPVLTAAGVNFVEVGTSATEGSPEYNKIASWYAGHKDVKFMFTVDSGDSNALAQFIHAQGLQGKVGGAGWDVGLPVVQGIQAGNLTFTIDQQAYLQGFDTIMQLFLYNASGGLMKPTNTDTGLGIVVKGNVSPYLATNRFEGTASAKKSLTPPSSIPT
ncbi:MAG TPA: substrate-binding domain-containing protein [Solirubrobacteraceae bacterium]|nr:substrate-binding domain-containing protein [Solirubrobacteraceae bacterium]